MTLPKASTHRSVYLLMTVCFIESSIVWKTLIDFKKAWIACLNGQIPGNSSLMLANTVIHCTRSQAPLIHDYIVTRDEHIMLLKFPMILSSNSFFLYLLFLKLFPEIKPGIGNLTCIYATNLRYNCYI